MSETNHNRNIRIQNMLILILLNFTDLPTNTGFENGIIFHRLGPSQNNIDTLRLQL